MIASDQFKKSSRGLVPTARNAARGLNTAICAKFPEAAKIDLKAWDQYLTVGFVWVALSGLLTKEIPKSAIEEIKTVIGDSLTRAFPEGVKALNHCTLFMNQTTGSDKNIQVDDALGYWIVWNLLGRDDFAEDEDKIARILGSIAVKEFASFWL
jgi:hypothetical protein